ncbi:MAG: redoxin family protein [Moraxellaceae bacterium]|nr:redoxin family protein [Moraxellaceae bacterium]
MKTVMVTALASLLLTPVLTHAAVKTGDKAPAFTLSDSTGKSRSLSEFSGKTVVLEWTNPGCPFVVKHYESGNIPGQQKAATSNGVVWLSINSSAAGKQGDITASEATRIANNWKSSPTAYLFDRDGKTGQAYGAKTTPQIFVIDGGGTVRYSGAIDSIPTAKKEDLARATQYVPAALAAVAAQQEISPATTQPYGCAVKY